MDVYISQLERGIDRIIMPQFPEIDHYRIDMKEHNLCTCKNEEI
jgi:hypothetical protein